MKKNFFVLLLAFACLLANANVYDFSLADFPRKSDETSDSPRIQRAVNAANSGVLFVPQGEYQIDKCIEISNGASLNLHKSAKFKAIKIPFVLITLAETRCFAIVMPILV